jgi:hypothetical protein
MRVLSASMAIVCLTIAAPVAAQSADPSMPVSPVQGSPMRGSPMQGSSMRGSSDALVAQAASVRRAPAKKPRIGFRGYGIVESESLTAKKSVDAVLGTSTLRMAGAGGDVVNLWKGVFGRVGVTHVQKTGHRVFLDGTTPIPVDVPLTIAMTPIEFGAGWRFPPLDRGRHVVPYVGAARLMLRYRETSQFADPDEDTDTSFGGSTIFGGVDVGIKFVHVAVEGLYRHVPNAIGTSGVSQGFSENNLGGGIIRLAVGIGF